jgi:integrase
MRNDERADYYAGAFAQYMAEFICFKRAQGLKYGCEALSLRAFSKFVDKHTSGEASLTREIIDEWCRFRPNETHSNQNNRVYVAREFLKYLSKQGAVVHLPRPPRKFPSSFTPYIFSQDELARFFVACDNISTRTPSVMPAMLPLLFRLLYGCGLRISEALSLRVADVDVDAGVITVLQAKCNKDRLIPLSDSLSRLFREYSSAFHKTAFPEARYFTHRDGRAIKKGNIYVWYRKILWAAGISHGGRGNGPRLHDLRHTFSVYALKAMTDSEMDIYCALPLLSTYLGHASVSATGQYVHLTQNMFPEIVSKVSAISAFVIPGGD